MPQPTPYSRATDFSSEEAAAVAGRSTVRTAALDAELDALQTNLEGLNANIEVLQRDDGELRDGIVKLSALAGEIRALLTINGGAPRGNWVTATAYALRDVVTQSGNTYLCAIPHTSSTFATDLAASRWQLVTLGAAPIASSIAFSPASGLTSTDVQNAIAEEATIRSGAIGALSLDLANTLTASKGAAMVGYRGRSVRDKLDEGISVEDFRQAGDPVDDDAPAINRCIAFCQDFNLTPALKPGKDYFLSSSLVFKHGRSAIDSQKYNVRLRGNNATLYPRPGVVALESEPRCLLADTGTGRGEADIDICELYIDGALAGTTGKAWVIGLAGYRCSNFAWSQLDDITVQNFATPNAVAAFIETRHIACSSVTIRTGTLNISADTTGSFCGDLVFHACELTGTVASRPFNITSGVTNAEVRGIVFSACDIYGTGGLINSSGTSARVGDIWLDNGTQFDGPGSPAGEIPITIQASGTSARIFQVHLEGVYFSSYTGACVYANSSGTARITQLTIKGGGINTCTTAAGSGNAVFFFLQVESVSVRDVEFDEITSSGGQYINIDGCTDVMVMGNKAANKIGVVYGVTIGNSSDRYTILGNQFSATTSAVNDYTGGTPQRQVANNLLVA